MCASRHESTDWVCVRSVCLCVRVLANANHKSSWNGYCVGGVGMSQRRWQDDTHSHKKNARSTRFVCRIYNVDVDKDFRFRFDDAKP